MKLLLLCLLLVWTPLFAQSPQSSPPLTDEEKRQVLGQLLELKTRRSEVRAYEDYVSRDTAEDERERELAAKMIAVEQQAAELARKERDLAIERAELYEQLYRTTGKGPGVGCKIARIFTLGIYRCK
jgi:hypothetical protein